MSNAGRRTSCLSATSAAVVVALAFTGCATKTDEQVRRAWDGASAVPGEAGSGNGSGRDRDPDGADAPEAVRVGWERLDQLVDAAVSEAMLGIDPGVLARLATQWCRVEPEPLGDERAPHWICVPDPPLALEGHAFDLEMGSEGVIGLVAHDLTEQQSLRLAKAALERTERWCTHETTTVKPTDPSPPPRAPALRTCVVEGNAVLSVGRYPDEEGAHWTVAVSVIDAS